MLVLRTLVPSYSVSLVTHPHDVSFWIFNVKKFLWLRKGDTFLSIKQQKTSRTQHLVLPLPGGWARWCKHLFRYLVKFCLYRRYQASQLVLVVKNPLASAGDIRDAGSIPELVRSPGEGNGNLFQYSCLENPMDRGAWWATVHRVARSQTQLKQFSTHRRYQTKKTFYSYLSVISQSRRF